MFSNRGRHDWNFWLWWVLDTAVASTVCFVIISLALLWLDLPFEADSEALRITFIDRLLGSFFFVFAGGIIGFGQWLALRMILPRSARWILISAAGWLIGYWSYLVLDGVVASILRPTQTQFLPWLIIGLWNGLFQWIFLRRQYPRVDIWLPVTILAFIIGSAGWNIGGIMGGVYTWTAAGAITGYTLLRFEADKVDSG